MPLDPVNALLGWLVQQGGNALGTGVRRMALGDAQERALHAVVSDAIDRAVQRVGGENNQFLKDVLTEHRDQLEAIRYLPTLAAAVQELVRSLEPPPGANPIAPPRLAEVLVEEIGRGILENTRRGGPLAPLVVEAGFIQLLGLSEQLDAVADLIRRRMSAPSPQPVPADDRRSLAFAYLDPAEDRTRILEEPFTGRDWMMQEIEQFIAGNDRGYIVIEADAGSGKTAFALWCSGRRDWPVHYSQYSSDARRTGSAVRNLAAQLIEEWDLTELAPDAALPANADWSSFLRQVLSSAAARRDAEPQTGDRRPIVLVVDGLDEAEDTAPSSLPWGLPDDMPQGVYIVATVRTGNLRHRPQCPLHWCAWRDRTTQQTTDMRMFLDEEVPLNFAVALVEAGADSDQFIATLMERSGHNWLYLHHVLAELTAGTRQVTDVPDLPRGLAAYYHNAVERLLGDEDEGGPREALLSTLAVLRRPVDRDALTRLAGTGRGSAGDRFLGRQLRPFCHVSESDRWQLGHVSFNEYLAAKSGAAGPAYLDEEQHRRLQRAARRAHRRISAYYLARFGGVETGLARLCADPGLAQCDDNYALEMLGHHLVAAGKTDNLHILLTRGSDAGNAWYAAHEAGARIDGYLRDLELARRSARSGTSLNAKLIWYALIRASIASASSILPPRVLARMVRSSRFPLWTPARAFTHVEQMTDRTAAAKAIGELAPLLRSEEVPGAASVTALCPDPFLAATTLLALIPKVPPNGWPPVFAAWRRINARHPDAAVLLTVALVRATSLGEVSAAETASAWSGSHTPLLLRALAARSVPDRALAVVAEVDNEFERCQLLAAILPELPATGLDVDQVLAVLRPCPGEYRTDVLIALAGWAPVDRLVDVLKFATGQANPQYVPPTSWHRRPWPTLLGVCAERVSGRATPAGLVDAALALFDTIPPYAAAAASAAFEKVLRAEHARLALEALAAHHLADPSDILLAVATAAKTLNREGGNGTNLASEWLYEVSGTPGWDSVPSLAPVLEFLPEQTRLEFAHDVANGILLPNYAELLAQAAPSLSETEKQAVLEICADSETGGAAKALAALDALAGELSEDHFADVLSRTLPGPVEPQWFAAVGALAQNLPDTERHVILEEALDSAARSGSRAQRFDYLAALGPWLEPGLAAEVMPRLPAPRSYFGTLRVLEALAPVLPRKLLSDAVAMISGDSRFEATDLAKIPTLLRRWGGEAGTGSSRTLFPPSLRRNYSEQLRIIAPYLSPALAEEALEATAEIRASTLAGAAALLPRLPAYHRPTVSREVLAGLAARVQDGPGRKTTPAEQAAILGCLAADEWSPEVAAAVRRFIDDHGLERCTGDESLGLLEHLPADMAVSVLPLLWNRIPPYRYAGIRAMAAVLPDDVRRETIARVIADGEIKRPYIDDIERARVLVELARVTPPGEERTRILTRVHAAVVEQGSWYSWVPIFRELLPLLDAGDRQTAVAAAIRMAIRSTRRDSDVETLLAIVNMLRGEELGHALEQARGLAEPGHRATFVAAVLRLACTLPVPERTAAVTIDPELLLIPDVGRGDLCTVLAAAAWRMNGELGPAGTTEVIDALKAVRKWW